MALRRETVTSRLNPVGVLKAFPAASASIPTGWLLCDGSAVSRTTYVDLFNLIGTLYGGGNGTTTFNLPNLKGNVPAGFSSGDANFGSLGGVGGVATVTLTTAQIPSHQHTGTTGTESASHSHSGTTALAGGHAHTAHALEPPGTIDDNGLPVVTGTSVVAFSTDPVGDHSHTFGTGGPSVTHTHSFTTNPAGSGSSHTNLQPFIVMNFIVKY